MVADETVYVGGKESVLYAVDTETGDTRWTFEMDVEGAVRSVPAIYDNTIYITGRNEEDFEGKVYAVNRNDGEQQWVASTDTRLAQPSPTVTDGTVYLTARDGIYALEAETGARTWSNSDVNPQLDAQYGAPAVASGFIYISGDDAVYAVDETTGEIQWTNSEKNWSSTSGAVAVADGRVFVGEVQTIAYDAATGEKLWESDEGSEVPAVANGTVYTHRDSGRIAAIDADTGDTKWTYQQGSKPPKIADGVVYTADGEPPRIHAVDAATGEALWSTELLELGTIRPPAIADGRLYATARSVNEQGLYALAPA